MTEDVVCPVCLKPPTTLRNETVDCPRCGKFKISDTVQAASDSLPNGGRDRFRLSAALRKMSDEGVDIMVTSHNIGDLIESARPPRTLMEGIDRLLEAIDHRSPAPTAFLRFDPNRDYPLLTVRDSQEAQQYVRKAAELHYIEQQSNTIRLDIEGWKRLDAITGNRVIGNQAFVAMRFHDDMDEPYWQGIDKALRELGWDPKCVKYMEHNGKIDDLIVAEIGRSALVIADFTGHRPSVYFEAGLAMGLGITVIWTCRQKDLRRAHFDTRQYSHVPWSTPAELYKRLKLRVQATVPRRT